MLSCRFQQCLGTFTILLVEACSETGIFRHLSDYLFRIRSFENTKAVTVIFFSKSSKFNIDLKNAGKIWEKLFSFSDNWIWLSILKFSLLQTGYISLVANGLINSPKIWHVSKRDIFKYNFLATDQLIWWRCCDADFNSVWARVPYSFSKHPLKRDFLDIYPTKFSESVTSKIQNLWGSSFYSKSLIFNLHFKNAAKSRENVFCFASELVSLNSPYEEQDIFHRQPMC